MQAPTSREALRRRFQARSASQPTASGYLLASLGDVQYAHAEFVEFQKRTELHDALKPLDSRIRSTAENRAARIADGDLNPRAIQDYRENYEKVQKILEEHGGSHANDVLGRFDYNHEAGQAVFQSRAELQAAGTPETGEIHHLSSISSQQGESAIDQAMNASSPDGLIKATQGAHIQHFHRNKTQDPTRYEGNVPEAQSDDIAERAGDEAWANEIPSRLIASSALGGLRGVWVGRRGGLRAMARGAASEGLWGAAASGAGALVGGGVRQIDDIPWHRAFTEGPDPSGTIHQHASETLGEGLLEFGGEVLDLGVTRTIHQLRGDLTRFRHGSLTARQFGHRALAVTTTVGWSEMKWQAAELGLSTLVEAAAGAQVPDPTGFSQAVLITLRVGHSAYRWKADAEISRQLDALRAEHLLKQALAGV